MLHLMHEKFPSLKFSTRKIYTDRATGRRKRLKIRLAVFTQIMTVTDRQTDRQTDITDAAYTAHSTAE